MTKRIYVVPAVGRAVPDPVQGDLLPKKGREVDDSDWWQRRKADKDVTIKPVKKAAE